MNSEKETKSIGLETKKLIIRPFKSDEWKNIQQLTINKMSPKKDPHDHDLPTDDNSCQKMAEYFSKNSDKYFAICLKDDQKLIGFLAFNDIDKNLQLDIGHVIHTDFQDNDHDFEALQAIIEYAFKTKDVNSIVTRNAPDWEEQLAPLKKLGLKPIKGKRGGELEITKEEWENNKNE